MTQNLGYRPSLNGLRAVAIALVLLLHADVPGFGGGAVGVDLFFALSGFLITTLLAEEFSLRAEIDIPRFWLRRALRLLPPLVLCLAVTLLVTRVATAPAIFERNVRTLPSILFYYSNWYRVAHGSLGTMEQAWSLSLEEQFYLIWPILLALAFSRLSSRTIMLLCLAGAAASLLDRIMIWDGSNVTRVISGTDTHCDGLLLGSALAIALRSDDWRAWLTPVCRRALPLAIGVIVVVTAVPNFSRVPAAYFDTEMTVGLSLVALASTVIVGYLVTAPSGAFARVLARRPMVWIGTISYGIYIWHDTVFHSVRYLLRGAPVIVVDLTEFTASVLVAAVSWKFLEGPLQRVRRRLHRVPDAA